MVARNLNAFFQGGERCLFFPQPEIGISQAGQRGMKRIDVIESAAKANGLRTSGAGLVEMSKDEKYRTQGRESGSSRVKGLAERRRTRHLGLVKGEHLFEMSSGRDLLTSVG